MMTAPAARAGFVLFCGAAAVVAVAANLPVLLRVPIVFWFVCACPGLAWAGLLRLRDEFAVWVLGVAFSLVLATFLSESLVLLKLWSPPAILAVLVVLSVPPCVYTLRTGHRIAAAEDAA
jgi:hypothetical protein